MTTWREAEPPRPPRIGPGGWLLALLRGALLVALVHGGLLILLLLRLVERPLCGARRPVTPWVTQGVCRLALMVLGVRLSRTGRPMRQPGALVANHASWLDIFTLNACGRICFVSKSEVARWPLIGWLARATGTVFIDRDPRRARAQQALFEARLRAGDRLLFFPEGTSTDGQRVLPFKSTLFGAFFADHLAGSMHVQPVSVRYRASGGRDPRAYAWWGDMEFGPHLVALLASPGIGRAEVIFHAPLAVAEHIGRKELAAAAEARVRGGFLTGAAARA